MSSDWDLVVSNGVSNPSLLVHSLIQQICPDCLYTVGQTLGGSALMGFAFGVHFFSILHSGSLTAEQTYLITPKILLLCL